MREQANLNPANRQLWLCSQLGKATEMCAGQSPPACEPIPSFVASFARLDVQEHRAEPHAGEVATLQCFLDGTSDRHAPRTLAARGLPCLSAVCAESLSRISSGSGFFFGHLTLARRLSRFRSAATHNPRAAP